MDMTQHAGEIVTYHADSHGGFYTTSLFWVCSRDEYYIHPFTQPDCPACGNCLVDAPKARINEVLRNAYEWRLDKNLIHQLEEIFPCCDLEMEPGEGLLVRTGGRVLPSQNACRMQKAVSYTADSWLEAVYEERISGWNDDF